jgi:hypothetical protein
LAAKNTLKYKRHHPPPFLAIVNELIDKCFAAIRRPDFKATISGLIQLIRLRLALQPLQPAPAVVRWLDRISPT